MAVITIEGRDYSVPDDTVTTDDEVRAIAVQISPAYATANVVRETKDNVLRIRAVKEAGTKGASSSVEVIEVLATLRAAPSFLNPALVTAWQLQQAERNGQLDLPCLITLQPRIEEAMEAGEVQQQDIAGFLSGLELARPIAPLIPPTGF